MCKTFLSIALISGLLCAGCGKEDENSPAAQPTPAETNNPQSVTRNNMTDSATDPLLGDSAAAEPSHSKWASLTRGAEKYEAIVAQISAAMAEQYKENLKPEENCVQVLRRLPAQGEKTEPGIVEFLAQKCDGQKPIVEGEKDPAFTLTFEKKKNKEGAPANQYLYSLILASEEHGKVPVGELTVSKKQEAGAESLTAEVSSLCQEVNGKKPCELELAEGKFVSLKIVAENVEAVRGSVEEANLTEIEHLEKNNNQIVQLGQKNTEYLAKLKKERETAAQSLKELQDQLAARERELQNVTKQSDEALKRQREQLQGEIDRLKNSMAAIDKQLVELKAELASERKRSEISQKNLEDSLRELEAVRQSANTVSEKIREHLKAHEEAKNEEGRGPTGNPPAVNRGTPPPTGDGSAPSDHS